MKWFPIYAKWFPIFARKSKWDPISEMGFETSAPTCPTPFGARLYPIFGRACGAIFFVFLHFRAFQTHFQHFLLLPGTEMCFKTAFLTEMSKIFHISNGKRCHYHCKTLIKGKERRRPEKIRFWLSFLMQKLRFYGSGQLRRPNILRFPERKLYRIEGPPPKKRS